MPINLIMKFSEAQVEQIVGIKDSMVEQIDKYEEGIEMLEKNIRVLDLFLKGSSYTKASQIETTRDETPRVEPQKVRVTPPPAPPPAPPPPAQNVTPIKKANSEEIIANVTVTPDTVSIIIKDTIAISADTPPFKSFFLDRIIGEMEEKDDKETQSGKLQKESAISCIVNKDGTNIQEIIIKNYRQKERMTELINTAGWSLNKMLENQSK